MQGRFKRFFNSLTGRLLVAAALWSVLALAIGGYILSFAFRSYVLSDVDARLEAQIDTMVGVSELAPDGMLRFTRPLFDQRFTTPYSGHYWQVSETGQTPFRSRSLWDHELTPDMGTVSFTLQFHSHSGPDGQVLRVAERDIILPEAERIFRYQAAQDMGAVQSAIDRFYGLLVNALALIMGTVTLALVLQVAYGLGPLRDIRKQLKTVRTGKDSRITGKYPADLSPLADEINALLGQNEHLVDRARTQVGNLAHALKTPLSVIQNEVAASDSEQAVLIKKQATEIREHIDHYLKRARIASGSVGAGVQVAERLAKITQAVRRLYSDKDIIFEIDCQTALRFNGDQRDLDEILGNIIENAGKWANRHVQIKVHVLKDSPIKPMLRLTICDDGLGVPDERDRAGLFERGKRLDEQMPGTGLGLNIVRDITELYGGQASLDVADLGGLKVVLTLPLKV